MSNVHTMKVYYKRTTRNGICKFVGENKEKISISKSNLAGIELIECNSYLLQIFRQTWELYLTNQIGALENIISIEPI